MTLGTAGHIDHGKTELVRALTGVDTDRLPEERERGISIELGYAPLELPSGRRLSLIDVPGHERFVRTMVAGATGIDMYLMVVAADDGVMPQTREHAAVLAALRVETGVVAITKTDLADPARAAAEAADLLPGAEVVAVSAREGRGLDELRAALERAANKAEARRLAAADSPGGGAPAATGAPGGGSARPDRSAGPTRLHVDRSFTIRGAGTVVTGTLWSGSVARGDEVLILPAGTSARVRSVQVHDEPCERAEAGRRVALNLAGVARDEVARGDVVVAGSADLAPTYRVDAALHWASPDHRPDGGARVAVHHGTRETAARLAELGGRFFQLRLEEPIVPARGDRLVVRALAPPDTLGGGVVLDPHPPRHGPSRDLLARLTRLERGEPEPAPAPAPEAPRSAPEPPPLSPAALALEARLRDAGHEPPLDADLLRHTGAEPPYDADVAPDLLAALRAHGRITRLGRGMHIHRDALAEVAERVTALIERDGPLTLAGLRDELGTSRRYAQALLEALDAERVTLRVGDERVLRRKSG